MIFTNLNSLEAELLNDTNFEGARPLVRELSDVLCLFIFGKRLIIKFLKNIIFNP